MHAHAHGDLHGGLAARRRRTARRLQVVLALSGLYMVAEVVGGLASGSLALLADAGHMFSDVAALGLSLFAVWLSQQPASAARTYGHHRVEILAALVNGVTLVVVAVMIVFEAVDRLRSPTAVLGVPMLAIAAGGLGVNLLSLAVLHGRRGEGLNLRAAWLHVLSDALGSLGAVGAGSVILAFGWTWADPVASLLIAGLVLRASLDLLREAVDVLLEAAPAHIEVEEVHDTLMATRGVSAVHDLHVWTITSGLVSLSCHVRMEPGVEGAALLREIQQRLRERFGIEHVTIQLEPFDFEEHVAVC